MKGQTERGRELSTPLQTIVVGLMDTKWEIATEA
jgi:hypothetical protein